MKKSFGQRLKELRGEESQESFCRKIQQKQGTYSAWERDNKDPASSAIALICKATGVSADWLLGLSSSSSGVHAVSTPPPAATPTEQYWRDLVASQQATIANLAAALNRCALPPTSQPPVARTGGSTATKTA